MLAGKLAASEPVAKTVLLRAPSALFVGDMRVHADRVVPVTMADAIRGVTQRLDRLPLGPSHDAVRDLLVDWGEIESAAADALSPETDDECLALGAWRLASDAIAEAV